MMAGCSKDVHTASKESASDDWLVNLELPVPIEFGSGSISTKASFDSMDDLLTIPGEKSYPFGVFAIDKSTESIIGDELLLNNERAIYIDTDEGKVFQFANTGNVEQPKYYPMVSDRSFDFYGYYSRQSSMELSESEETPTRLSVNVDVGSLNSDILWAKATTGAAEDGYNARYIRKNRDKKPVLNFQHVTSCIKFRAVYAPNEDEIAPEMSEIKVSSITIKNIHTKAKLCVIDIANSDNESELTVTGDPTDVQITGSNAYKTNLIKSKSLDGSEYAAALLCDDFFIAPQDEALDVQFVIKYTPVDGSELSQTVTYTLDPSKLTSNENGEIEDENGNVIRLFEAGYQYGFNLKIYSPEKISIDVTLDRYKNAFGDDVFADIVIE